MPPSRHELGPIQTSLYSWKANDAMNQARVTQYDEYDEYCAEDPEAEGKEGILAYWQRNSMR